MAPTSFAPLGSPSGGASVSFTAFPGSIIGWCKRRNAVSYAADEHADDGEPRAHIELERAGDAVAAGAASCEARAEGHEHAPRETNHATQSDAVAEPVHPHRVQPFVAEFRRRSTQR